MSPFQLGPYPLTFIVDEQARLFFLIAAAVFFAVFLSLSDNLSGLMKQIDAGLYLSGCAFLALSMVAVVASADAITFIFFWEVMSLASFAIVASDQTRKRNTSSAIIYLGTTRISGCFLAAGFLNMHAVCGSWQFNRWDFSDPASYISASLLLVGFSIKAGLWPFHLWVPYAYKSAPGPGSAILSGLMSKVTIFSLIKLLVDHNLNCSYLIWTMYAFGLVTAFWGVLFAMVQTDLKKAVAYSSIENMGILILLISVCLQAKAAGSGEIAALAFTGVLIHCVNHAGFKTLLFLCVAALELKVGETELAHLGGLSKRMPVTWFATLCASMCACAMPWLNGFPGKWLLYQSLLGLALLSKTSYFEKGAYLIAVCVLASVGALALAAFARLLSVGFLGNFRTSSLTHVNEVNATTCGALLFLVMLCVVSALATRPLLRLLLINQAGYAPNLMALPIPDNSIALVLLLILLALYIILNVRAKPRPFVTWDCGYGSVPLRAQVSSDSYAQPLARIFRPILKYRNEAEIYGADRRHFPERIKIRTTVVSVLEKLVYMPLLKLVVVISKTVARLQAGSIHLYLLYVILTLIFLLIMGSWL